MRFTRGLLIIIVVIGSFWLYEIEKNSSESGTVKQFELVVFEYGNGHWAYDIYEDSSLLIRQYQYPAISGIHPFKSKAEATKIGEIVLEKMRSGGPPVLNPDDFLSKGMSDE